MKQELEDALCKKYPVVTGTYGKRSYQYIPFFGLRIRNNWLIKQTLRVMSIFNKEADLPIYRPYGCHDPFAMFGFEVGEGWYNLVDRMLNQLEPIAIESNKKHKDKYDDCSFCLSQVKEKFATLRVYTTYSVEEAEAVIAAFESESAKTCEVCGKPGRIVGKGWYSTRCVECSPDGN